MRERIWDLSLIRLIGTIMMWRRIIRGLGIIIIGIMLRIIKISNKFIVQNYLLNNINSTKKMGKIKISFSKSLDKSISFKKSIS